MASNTASRFAIGEGQREGGVIEKIPEGQNPIHKWLKFIRTEKKNWSSGDKRDTKKSHTNSRTRREQLESSDYQLPGEFLKTGTCLVIYSRRAGGRTKKVQIQDKKLL